jgi:hypothetical protein
LQEWEETLGILHADKTQMHVQPTITFGYCIYERQDESMQMAIKD